MCTAITITLPEMGERRRNRNPPPQNLAHLHAPLRSPTKI